MALNTVVLNQANVPAPAAPPTYYVLDANGGVVPAGQKRWLAEIETAGLPPGQLLGAIYLEYQKNGVWVQDAGAPNLRTGLQGRRLDTTVASFGSSIGAYDSFGNLVGPYPTRYRFRVEQCPGYVLPNLKLTLIDTL